MQRFKDHLFKQWTKDGLVNSKTLQQYIREWKQEFNIGPDRMHTARFCPKASWMALNGWDVFHAIAVSGKHRGTEVIGRH